MDYNDIERSMLKNIREIQRGTYLFENEDLEKDLTSDNDSVKPNDNDYQTEIKKFKTQITSRVEISTFLIYPETNNVVFGGVFNDITGFSFEMSLSEKDGLYINCENLQINDDITQRLQKLNGYYKNWSEEWANKVISEYKNS